MLIYLSYFLAYRFGHDYCCSVEADCCFLSVYLTKLHLQLSGDTLSSCFCRRWRSSFHIISGGGISFLHWTISSGFWTDVISGNTISHSLSHQYLITFDLFIEIKTRDIIIQAVFFTQIDSRNNPHSTNFQLQGGRQNHAKSHSIFQCEVIDI